MGLNVPQITNKKKNTSKKKSSHYDPFIQMDSQTLLWAVSCRNYSLSIKLHPPTISLCRGKRASTHRRERSSCLYQRGMQTLMASSSAVFHEFASLCLALHRYELSLQTVISGKTLYCWVFRMQFFGTLSLTSPAPFRSIIFERRRDFSRISATHTETMQMDEQRYKYSSFGVNCPFNVFLFRKIQDMLKEHFIINEILSESNLADAKCGTSVLKH